jgi:hypothetical protein
MLLWDLALSFWFCLAWRLKNLVHRPCQVHVELGLGSEYLVLSYLEAGELGLGSKHLVLSYLEAGELGLGSKHLVLSYLEAGELGLGSKHLVLSYLEAGELGLDPVKRLKCAWSC